MLLRFPTSVSEAQECLADGAVPIGGATLVWAAWQRDGFPVRAFSLRELPRANVIGPTDLGAAVVLHRIDERVPEAMHRAAASIGTGAVRRTATVGGNIVGSSLRCLLPAALVLGARATVLESDGVHETDLAEVVAKRPLLLGLHWTAPLVSAHRKQPGAEGGGPPLVVAAAVHADDRGGFLLRVAVRDGYDVLADSTLCDADADADAGTSASAGAERALRALRGTALSHLPATAWETVAHQVTGLLGRLADPR
ncbi:FAD binding domain-containing protein [Streptomyces sp. NPDC046985]|uniref:FAD binding domain-containing protein n=1 Tax=Streptomyces sp. NPDC046985 TaxID=3155377 RepID=UPI0033FA5270